MNLFPRPKARRATIAVIHSTALTLAQWRNSPELVAYAATLLADPRFQTLLDVLRSESPASYALALGATHDDQIAHSYKAAGYQLCLNNLEALAQRQHTPGTVEATFEAPAPRAPLPLD
jgi:hypothetical protein